MQGSYVGLNIDNARKYGSGSDVYWQVRARLGSEGLVSFSGAKQNDNGQFKYLFGMATMTSSNPDDNTEGKAAWAKAQLVDAIGSDYEDNQSYFGGMVNFVCFELCGGVGKAESKVVNGNSTLSTKAQHGYEIFVKDEGDVVKNGISGRALNKNGSSPRANQQVNAWNKEAGFDKYDARIVDQFNDRFDALIWENNYALKLWRAGNSMDRHLDPRPWEN
jgi:hypothetical protein